MARTVIGPDRGVLTVIFEFDIEPEQRQPLVDGVSRLGDEVISPRPGFVSAALHVSRDGRKALVYVQWESQEAFDAFRADAAAQGRIRPVIAPYGPKPRVYDIVHAVAPD